MITEYDVSILALQAISNLRVATAAEIINHIANKRRIANDAVAYIVGHLIRIGLVVGYPGKGGALVFELA